MSDTKSTKHTIESGDTVENNNPPQQTARYRMVVSHPEDDDTDSSVHSADFRHVQHGQGSCACCGPRAK